MVSSSLRVSRGLLLFGETVEAGLNRNLLLRLASVSNNSFRDHAFELGARNEPGLRFFDSTNGFLRFGPGAGLVVGVSVGSGSMHAAIVDANARLHHDRRLKPHPGQLSLEPTKLLDRIKAVVAEVLAAAFEDEQLLVDGALPFLGVAIAWAVPIDRDDRPLGAALHSHWLDGASMKDKVALHLDVKRERSHALNDTHATAVGVAWHQTREPAHEHQRFARMAIVMRLAGGIGAASIIVEKPDQVRVPQVALELGPTSGFPHSVLLGGRDLRAGELGHLSMDRALIEGRNADLPTDLGPLTAFKCSCTAPDEPVPDHLEAFACTAALASRVARGEPECDVVQRIIDNPDVPVHHRALEDVGVLVGQALRGPVLMLNPATITLTGILAVPTVNKAVKHSLRESRPFGNHPEFRALEGDTNHLIRVQGAGLAIIRAKVHRELEYLVGGKKNDSLGRVRALTEPITRAPWES